MSTPAKKRRYSKKYGFLVGRYKQYRRTIGRYRTPMTFEEFMPFAAATNKELLKSHRRY